MNQSIVNVGRKTEQTLTAPYPDHLHVIGVPPIDDAKGWLDEFPEEGLTELRHHPPYVRMIGERLDPLKNLNYQSYANTGHTLFRVPSPQFLDIAERRFGEANANSGH